MERLHEVLERTLEAVPLPLILVGNDERVAALNEGARKLFGRGLVGRHYIAVLRQPALLDCVETVLRQRSAGQARFLTREAQRDATWKVSVRPIDVLSGPGALMTFEDATATEEADQIRRDFVANVSHELRTPLTAMLGFIETLLGAARDDPHAQERFLRIMEQEATRMNRLVRDLLSLSRVESEERVRPTSVVDVHDLISSVVSALNNIAHVEEVRFKLELPNTPLELQGDRDQLFQVFTNLVENAIKYGGRNKDVCISASESERDPVLRAPAIRISVKDEGTGIDAIHIPRLTERFYRVDTHRSRELGGTGLGLAIVKHIVSRHRGRLRIESVRGLGSTFSVILPKNVRDIPKGEERQKTLA